MGLNISDDGEFGSLPAAGQQPYLPYLLTIPCGAVFGAVSLIGLLIWSIQGMGIAGGGDGLDGIEYAFLFALILGTVGGGAAGAFVSWCFHSSGKAK